MTFITYKIINLALLALFGSFGDFGAFLAPKSPKSPKKSDYKVCFFSDLRRWNAFLILFFMFVGQFRVQASESDDKNEDTEASHSRKSKCKL